MPISRPRRRAAKAATLGIVASASIAIPAWAGINVSASVDFEGSLPVAKAQYFELGPPGTASLYTPSLHDGRFGLHVAAQGLGIGQIVTRNDFACPSDAPNPVLQILVTGPRGSADVALHVQGTSKAPDGKSIVFDQTVSNNTGVVSTFSETQILKQCSE